MKFVLSLLCLAAAGFAGYLLEPSLRDGLVGRSASAPEVALADEAGEVPPPIAAPAVAESPAAPAVVKEEPPVPAPQPEPEPAPEPEPEPAVVEEAPEPPAPAVPVVLGPEEIVKLMQESIRSRQVTDFSFEEVLTWKAGEEEEMDGQRYQTGLVTYKAETILGVKTVPAKALIQNGKVRKWIWPNTKTEIK